MGETTRPRAERARRPRTERTIIMTKNNAPGTLPGLFRMLVLALLALTMGALPIAANAQDSSSSAPAADASAAPAPAPIDPKAVVATVGGQNITEADLGFEADKLGQQQLQQIPQESLRAVLLAQLITTKLMAAAAKTEGLDQGDEYKLYQQFVVDQALYQAYVGNDIVKAVTDADVKAAYDKQVAAMPAQDEVHARHILLSSEDDAKAIKAQLDAGADFETLAKQKSTEPGAAQSGGDLGYFTADKMVKPFADAAFALKVGEISQPIQTQFGWHIIQVLDRRPAAKPTLDELSDQIRQQLYGQKFRDLLAKLQAGATITIADPALKAQVDAQMAPPPAAPAQ